jgi:hypothetical protein
LDWLHRSPVSAVNNEGIVAGDTGVGISSNGVGAGVNVDDDFDDIGMETDVGAAVEGEDLSIPAEVEAGSSSVQLFNKSQLAKLALLPMNARLQGSDMDSEESDFDEDKAYGGLENVVVPITPLGGIIPNPPVPLFHGGRREYFCFSSGS